MWHINSFHFNWIHKTDERLKLSVQVTAHSTTIVLTPPPLKKEKIVKKKNKWRKNYEKEEKYMS